MGFLEIKPNERPHTCPTPHTQYGEGSRWQCDFCSKVYVLDEGLERNEYFKWWRLEK